MNLPTLLTVIVAVGFAFLLYRMLKPGARDRLQPHARIPLDDDRPSTDIRAPQPPKPRSGDAR